MWFSVKVAYDDDGESNILECIVLAIESKVLINAFVAVAMLMIFS